MADAPFNFYGDAAHEPFVFPAARPSDTGALLIHGFMGSAKELRPLGEQLARAGIDAHGILLPGFGAGVSRLASVKRAEWLDAAHLAWSDVCRRYTRTVLLGYSMGGAVGVPLAARRAPDRLILLAPFIRIADRRAVALPVLQYVMKAFKPYERADFSNPQVRWDFQHIGPDIDLSDPVMQERLRREATIPTSSLVQLQLMCRAAARVAGRSTAPTLIVQGTRDTITRPVDTRRLARKLGGPLTLTEIEADHLLPFDDRPWWPVVRDQVVRFAAAAQDP
jgi:carboxylesterase